MLLARALATSVAVAEGRAQTPDPGLRKLVDAARAEGFATLYAGLTPIQANALATGFSKFYEIPVRIQRLVTGQLTARFAAEQAANANAADLVIQSDQLFVTDGARKGWFMQIGRDELPSLRAWPAQSWVQGCSAPVVLLPWGFTYNTRKLTGDNQPSSWEDLLKPAYRGQIILTDPSSTPSLLVNIAFLQQTFGDDYLRDFAKQAFTLIPSLVPGLQQLAAGEKTLLVQTVPGADAELIKQGAPLKTVIPGKHGGFAQYASVAAKAPHPNAAKLLLDFILSREGQQILAKDAGYSILGPLEGSLPGNPFALIDWEQMMRDRAHLLGLLGL